MNYILMILTALFPFMHGMRYEVELAECDEKQILIETNDEIVEVNLFNIMISEKGKKQICPLLEQADLLEVEVDASSALDAPLDVYLFVDGMLLQQHLLEQEVAVIAIHNPEYRYSENMEEASHTKKTMASTKKKQPTPNDKRGTWMITTFTIFWLIFCIIFLRKLRYHTLNR